MVDWWDGCFRSLVRRDLVVRYDLLLWKKLEEVLHDWLLFNDFFMMMFFIYTLRFILNKGDYQY